MSGQILEKPGTSFIVRPLRGTAIDRRGVSFGSSGIVDWPCLYYIDLEAKGEVSIERVLGHAFR